MDNITVEINEMETTKSTINEIKRVFFFKKNKTEEPSKRKNILLKLIKLAILKGRDTNENRKSLECTFKIYILLS